MANANNMVNIAEDEFQELVGQNGSCISKAEQGVICENCTQTHGSGVQDGFMAEATQTSMAMDNFYPFPYNDISKDWEEREESRHSSLPIDDKKRDMVDLEPVCKIPHSRSTFIGMSYDYNLMATIYEFLSFRVSSMV